MDQMDTLEEMHQEIMSRVHSVIVNVQEYQSYFRKYSHLWMDDKIKFMKQFLLYGRFLSTEEVELYADYELQKCSPQLDHFKQQVLFQHPFKKKILLFICFYSFVLLNYLHYFDLPIKIQNCNHLLFLKISIYEALHQEVSELENQKTFNGWFQVDIKPFKVSLMNTIKKWSWMLKKHLLNHVTQR